MYNVFFISYIVLLLLSLFFSYQEDRFKKNDRIIIVFVFIISTSILMAMRPLEVADTQNYLEVFNEAEGLSNVKYRFGVRYKGLDYGFVWLMNCFKFLSSNPKFFFGCIALLNNTLILIGCCYCEKYILNTEDTHILHIWALYMLYCALHYSGIAIRSGLSIGLGLCAIACFLKRHYILGVLLLFCSLNIHSTALIFLFIIPILFLKKTYFKERTFIIFLFLLSMFLLFNITEKFITAIAQFMLNLLQRFGIEGFGGYLSLSALEFKVGITDWYMLIVVGGLTVLTFWHSLKRNDFVFLIAIGLCIVCIAYPIRAISRAYDFFMVFMIPIFSSFFSKDNCRYNRKALVRFLEVVLFVVQFKRCY